MLCWYLYRQWDQSCKDEIRTRRCNATQALFISEIHLVQTCLCFRRAPRRHVLNSCTSLPFANPDGYRHHLSTQNSNVNCSFIFFFIRVERCSRSCRCMKLQPCLCSHRESLCIMARRGTSYRRFRDSVEEEDDLCAARHATPHSARRRFHVSREFCPTDLPHS